MNFSFDTPEPSLRFAGLELAFTVLSRENAYHLDERKMAVEAICDDRMDLNWVGATEVLEQVSTSRTSVGALVGVYRATASPLRCICRGTTS
jgi:hypothetical protein